MATRASSLNRLSFVRCILVNAITSVEVIYRSPSPAFQSENVRFLLSWLRSLTNARFVTRRWSKSQRDSHGIFGRKTNRSVLQQDRVADWKCSKLLTFPLTKYYGEIWRDSQRFRIRGRKDFKISERRIINIGESCIWKWKTIEDMFRIIFIRESFFSFLETLKILKVSLDNANWELLRKHIQAKVTF